MVHDRVVGELEVVDRTGRRPQDDVEDEVVDAVDVLDTTAAGGDGPPGAVLVRRGHVAEQIAAQFLELGRLDDGRCGEGLVKGEGEPVDRQLYLAGHLVGCDVEQDRRGAERVRVGPRRRRG